MSELRLLLDAASQRALHDPDAALAMFAEAARLGEAENSDLVAHAFEAMGRIALGRGEQGFAADALAAAEREAQRTGDLLVLARSRAARATLVHARPFTDAADAFAAELRQASDALDAALISPDPLPALHASRTRLELRRRLPPSRPFAVVEHALGLSPVAMAALGAIAHATLHPEAARHLLPGASWPRRLAAWIAPAFAAMPQIESVLATLAERGLIRGDAITPDVESLLDGRAEPLPPDGFRRATISPAWRELPSPDADGPAAFARVLVVTGPPVAATDRVAQLGWARGWPLLLVRALPELDVPTAAAELAREALVFDRLIAVDVHALDPARARLLLVELAARLTRIIAIAPAPMALPVATVHA